MKTLSLLAILFTCSASAQTNYASRVQTRVTSEAYSIEKQSRTHAFLHARASHYLQRECEKSLDQRFSFHYSVARISTREIAKINGKPMYISSLIMGGYCK